MPRFIVKFNMTSKRERKKSRWVDAKLGVFSSREAAREAMLEQIAKWGGEEFEDYRVVLESSHA